MLCPYSRCNRPREAFWRHGGAFRTKTTKPSSALGKKGNRVKNDNKPVTPQEANASLVLETNLSAKCPTNGRTLQEACDECEREFNVRERCFPKWVTEGRLGRSDAKDRLERLAAACYFLQSLSHGDLEGCLEAMASAPVKSDEPF